ncbi:MAG TPA: DUF58 domain-containing protein [bacterium]|nr:DUF58 domain-containing protein [bacterium]
MALELGLEPNFFRRLERLTLLSRRLGAAPQKGIRQSRSHGASVEFADFRDYLPGDDTRFLDWNAYARLEKLFIKLFHEEASLNLHLLIDTSASMGFGEPGKLTAAARMAAALAYIALARLDAVTVAALPGAGAPPLSPRRGRRQIHAVLRFLRDLEAHGTLNLTPALRRYGSHPAQNALAVVISDFLDPDGCSEGLAYLRHRKFDVVMLHLLTPEELNPRFGGDRLLADVETGTELDVTASPRLFRRYQAALREHGDGLEEFARRHGMAYARVVTTTPLEEVVLTCLRQRRVLT